MMNTKLNDLLPRDEHGRHQWWLTLSPKADDAQARAAFQRKHGYPAAEVHRGKVLVYAGPIGRGARSEGWRTTETNATISETVCV